MTRNDLPDFVKQTVARPSNGYVIAEVGVYRGIYLDIYFPHFRNDMVFLADMWSSKGNWPAYRDSPGLVEAGYERIVRDYNLPNVHLLRMRSHLAARMFGEEVFDWVYIDASHTYEGAVLDIITWLPLVKRGGVISGHDFDPPATATDAADFGVEEAVRDMFEDNFRLTDESCFKSWYVIK